MICIRLTICKPERGHEQEVERILNRLDELLSKEEGYIMGGYFQTVERPGASAPDGVEEVGRFALWKDSHLADRASSSEDVIALRSQLHLAIQPGHVEGLYDFPGTIRGSFPKA